MSKGLEAIELLTDSVYYAVIECKENISTETKKAYLNAYNTIEKELKALEIIKETPEFAWYVTIYKDAYEMVSDVKGFRVNNSVEELQQMFDLLKEVLL